MLQVIFQSETKKGVYKHGDYSTAKYPTSENNRKTGRMDPVKIFPYTNYIKYIGNFGWLS